MANSDTSPKDQTITLTLSRAEYADLIKLAYAGDWLVNAIRPPGETIDKYKHIEQSVFKTGLANGFTELLEASDEDGDISPTNELEESDVAEYIQDYNEQTMWEELIDALATRDFERKYVEAQIDAMSESERIDKQSHFLDKYGEEFEEHGTDRLQIVT